MKNSFLRRSISLLLSLIICLSTIVGVALTASAASTTGKAIVIGYPRNGDTNYSTVTWGHDELHYMGGWMCHKGRYTTFYTMNSYKGNICYCIEPGRPLDTGLVFTQKDEDFFDNFPEAYNSTISADDIKLFLGRILQYGYTGQISDSWKSQNAEDADTMSKAFATQLLVWETVVGERDEYFNHVTPYGYNAILEQVRGDHPLRNGIMNYYNAIASAVQQHTKLPSFLSRTAGKAQTVELSWDGSRYCAELTDTNGVIDNYNYSAPGMNCVVSGNKLIITSNSAPTDKVTLTAEKKSSQRRGLIIWSDGAYQPGGGNQDTVTFGQQVDDPVKGYISLKVSYGSAKIVKVCLSFDSLLSYLGSIESSLKAVSDSGKVLIDQLLITGNNDNRFLSCDFSHGKLDFTTARIVNPANFFREETVDLLHDNYGYVENSILTDSQRQKVRDKVAF